MTYKVLIVEDHPFQSAYVQELFCSLGWASVEAAQSGYEAIEMITHQDFDLVLSDLMMPGMDGIQLVQKLAQLQHRPTLAFMSSASRRMMISASLAAKDLGFKVLGQLTKPVSLSTLGKLLEKLLVSRSAPANLPKAPLDPGYEALSSALRLGQIQPWFQPKKSLRTGKIVAAEALARWPQDELCVLMPRDFLPGIMRYNLEHALLTQCVVQTISAQSKWRAQGYDIPVSINLPTHLLDDDGLPDYLHELVVQAGGKPSKISFEIMENSEAKGLGHYFAGVCRLRFKGFGLSQDDFGKGYSSIFNLVSTPFTELKIDRSLVSGCVENENLAAALPSIAALGKKLGLNVVAEGVETAEELALLKNAQCDQVQGFLISKAIDATRFLTLLSADGPAVG